MPDRADHTERIERLAQARELARANPSGMFRRFQSIFLADGSQWEQQDDGRITLTFAPYGYGAALARLRAREVGNV